MFEGALPAPVEKSILVLLGLTFLGVLANLYRRLWNSVTGLGAEARSEVCGDFPGCRNGAAIAGWDVGKKTRT